MAMDRPPEVPGQLAAFFGPLARAGDPETSHEAARSLSHEHLRETQQLVLAWLHEHGPSTDEELVAGLAGRLSPSGARTRRSELVALRVVEDSGERRRIASGRNAIVWRVAR